MQSTNYNLATSHHNSLVSSYTPIFNYQNQAYTSTLNFKQPLNDDWTKEKINKLEPYFANKEKSKTSSNWQEVVTYIKKLLPFSKPNNPTKENNIIIRPTKTRKEETISSSILDREKRAVSPYRTARNLVMYNQEGEELARIVVTDNLPCISFSAPGGELTVQCPIQFIPEVKWFAVRSDICTSLTNLIENNRVKCPNTNIDFLKDYTNTVTERYGIISVNDETKHPDAVYHVIMRNQNEDEIARLYVEENHQCSYGYTFGGKLKVNCPPRPLKEIKHYSLQTDRCEPFLNLLERARVSCSTTDNNFHHLPAFLKNTTNVVRESFGPYFEPYSSSITMQAPITTIKKITKTETITDTTTELSTVTSFRKIPTTITSTTVVPTTIVSFSKVPTTISTTLIVPTTITSTTTVTATVMQCSGTLACFCAIFPSNGDCLICVAFPFLPFCRGCATISDPNCMLCSVRPELFPNCFACDATQGACYNCKFFPTQPVCQITTRSTSINSNLTSLALKNNSNIFLDLIPTSKINTTLELANLTSIALKNNSKVLQEAANPSSVLVQPTVTANQGARQR